MSTVAKTALNIKMALKVPWRSPAGYKVCGGDWEGAGPLTFCGFILNGVITPCFPNKGASRIFFLVPRITQEVAQR